jgi:FkbM family methyltransferase
MTDINEATYLNLEPGTVFDIGANHGFYVERMALQGHKVYAFEPHPDNIHILTEKFGTSEDVVVVPLALSNYTGEAGLYVAGNPGGHSISKAVSDIGTWGHAKTPHPVACMTIDDFVNTENISNLISMKIDVEGAEEYVLDGAYNTLRAFNLVVALETHQTIDCNNVFQLIKEAGYTIFDASGVKQDCITVDNAYIIRKINAI